MDLLPMNFRTRKWVKPEDLNPNGTLFGGSLLRWIDEELGISATQFGRTSITLRCEVRNMVTHKSILTIDKIVFVNMGADDQPLPHGRTNVMLDGESA